MKYDTNVYRPPSEANTLLLQVTSGCSNNNCTYCNMYKDVTFKTESLEQIEKDLIEAQTYYSQTERVYLLNGDPFSLSADKLKSIANLIHKYLPKCETITMYASIKNIKNKSINELKELRSLGINYLYIGIETGNDEVLSKIKKGNSSDEAIYELKKLNEANIDFVSIIMTGIAGHGKSTENALATARLLNSVKSKVIGFMSLILLPGSELYSEYQKGDFVEATNIEKLLETKTLIENLNLKDTTAVSTIHMSNLLSLNGSLPKDKDIFIQKLNNVIKGGSK